MENKETRSCKHCGALDYDCNGQTIITTVIHHDESGNEVWSQLCSICWANIDKNNE